MISKILTIFSVLNKLLGLYSQWSIKRSAYKEIRGEVNAKIIKGNRARNLVDTDREYAKLLAQELKLDGQLLSKLPADMPKSDRRPSNNKSDIKELCNIQGAVYPYSRRSLRRLQTCHRDLQLMCLELSKHADATVIQGYRTKEEQDKAFKRGASKVKYPNSKHNKQPSDAVDIVPAKAPKLWAKGKDLPAIEYYRFERLMKKSADAVGVSYRWGGDWDGDGDYSDQTFNDFAHFERKV